jgi:hypothetical protein
VSVNVPVITGGAQTLLRTLKRPSRARGSSSDNRGGAPIVGSYAEPVMERWEAADADNTRRKKP